MKLKDNGAVAAGLGVSCCILPLILIAVGLGGSVLAVFLVKYKAYLMTLAVGVLAYSWFQYSRDMKLCDTQVCEIAGGKPRKWMLGVNTTVVAFFFVITYTPAGTLVGIDYVGGSTVTAEASVPSGPMTVAPASALRTVGPTSGTASGPSRVERLALRVEGMS